MNNALPTSGFKGFDAAGSDFILQHNVDAADMYMGYQYGDWSFSTEYLTSVRRYDAADMYFGTITTGVKPAAWQTEVDYRTTFMGSQQQPVSYTDITWEAVAMNLPKHSFTFVYDVQVFKHTVVGIEFRHDKNYKEGTAGGGATTLGVQGIDPECERLRNIVTAMWCTSDFLMQARFSRAFLSIAMTTAFLMIVIGGLINGSFAMFSKYAKGWHLKKSGSVMQ